MKGDFAKISFKILLGYPIFSQMQTAHTGWKFWVLCIILIIWLIHIADNIKWKSDN